MAFFRRKKTKTPKISTLLSVSAAIPLRETIGADIAALDFLREIRKGLKIKIILNHLDTSNFPHDRFLEGKTIKAAFEEKGIKFEPLSQDFEHELLNGIRDYLSGQEYIPDNELILTQKQLVNILHDNLSRSISHRTASQTLNRYFPTLFNGYTIPDIIHYYYLKPEQTKKCLKSCKTYLSKRTQPS